MCEFYWIFFFPKLLTFTPLHNYCRSANPAPTLTKPSVAWNFYQSWTLQTRTIMQYALSAKPFREVRGTASKNNTVLVLRQYFPMISSQNCGIQFRGWTMLNAITHGFTHVFWTMSKVSPFFSITISPWKAGNGRSRNCIQIATLCAWGKSRIVLFCCFQLSCFLGKLRL